MAHKTGVGSTQNGRNSKGKHLGLKCNNLQKVKSGTILVRQVGLTFSGGKNIGISTNYTLYAKKSGIVKINKKRLELS